MDLTDKQSRLAAIIRDHAPILIAFSGGVDSSLLAAMAREVLNPEQIRCVLVDGPEVPRKALKEAISTAHTLTVPLEIITGESLPADVKCDNPSDRCRHCKIGTYETLAKAAERYGTRYIADGANVSDLGEHRPGIEAFSSCGVIHPFIMAGITKSEIREIARQKGLAFWNKPSAACLYSRIPYGDEITDEKLQMIEKGEELLTSLDIAQVRVRHYGTIARIEVHHDDFEKIILMRDLIDEKLREVGFSYICLDLKGYRSGSMDEVLPRETQS